MVRGVYQIGRGFVGNDEVITLTFRAAVGEPESYEEIQIEGEPAFSSTHRRRHQRRYRHLRRDAQRRPLDPRSRSRTQDDGGPPRPLLVHDISIGGNSLASRHLWIVLREPGDESCGRPNAAVNQDRRKKVWRPWNRRQQASLGAEFLPQDLVLLLEGRDHILSVIFAGPSLRHRGVKSSSNGLGIRIPENHASPLRL